MIAHVGPFPIEETIGAFGPFLLTVIAAGVATIRARVRRSR
jgi:hypothetical protein